MNKIETILKMLLEIASLDNFTIDEGVLYLITDGEPTISTYFNSEGDVDYISTFNIRLEDICEINDIRQICYAQKAITITTEDYTATLTSTGCNIVAF